MAPRLPYTYLTRPSLFFPQVVYAVVGGEGRRGRLTTGLLKPDVDVACDYCHYLTVLLYLKVCVWGGGERGEGVGTHEKRLAPF